MTTPRHRCGLIVPTKKRSASPPELESLNKKPRSAMDDVIAALQLQHQLDFPTDLEKKRNVQYYKDQVRADEHIHREIQKAANSSLLRLPTEILDVIYDKVFDHQILRVSVVKDKARLTSATDCQLVTIPGVCCKFRQDAARFICKNITLEIATFKFVSMLDTWRATIYSNVGGFHGFVKSTPPAWAGRVQIVGVMKGSIGQGHLGLNKVRGCTSAGLKFLDCKAMMEGYIRQVYPDAKVTFRVITDISLL